MVLDLYAAVARGGNSHSLRHAAQPTGDVSERAANSMLVTFESKILSRRLHPLDVLVHKTIFAVPEQRFQQLKFRHTARQEGGFPFALFPFLRGIGVIGDPAAHPHDSFVFLDEDTLYAARDVNGVRPLVLGRLERGWVVASETAALGICVSVVMAIGVYPQVFAHLGDVARLGQ